eukprot:1144497-Pelagomonas_calceolata.AAC.4
MVMEGGRATEYRSLEPVSAWGPHYAWTGLVQAQERRSKDPRKKSHGRMKLWMVVRSLALPNLFRNNQDYRNGRHAQGALSSEGVELEEGTRNMRTRHGACCVEETTAATAPHQP